MPLKLVKAPADFKTNKPMYKPYKSDKSGKDGMVYVKSSSGVACLIIQVLPLEKVI
jgi:hypothetical protein